MGSWAENLTNRFSEHLALFALGAFYWRHRIEFETDEFRVNSDPFGINSESIRGQFGVNLDQFGIDLSQSGKVSAKFCPNEDRLNHGRPSQKQKLARSHFRAEGPRQKSILKIGSRIFLDPKNLVEYDQFFGIVTISSQTSCTVKWVFVEASITLFSVLSYIKFIQIIFVAGSGK